MRYKKQEQFVKIGVKNQDKIRNAHVTVVGIGALGSVVLDMLARAGIGRIKVIDRDIVEISNLQRQSLFSEEDLGKPKVSVAKDKITAINSEINLEVNLVDLDFDNISLLNSDLIIDCTDNMYTRFLINEYAKKNNIPWIYGSVIGSKGMTMTITKNSPCFACIFNEPNTALETCDTAGIINTTPHALAAIQVTEAIKLITEQDHNQDLIYYELWNHKIEKFKINNKKDCKVCNGIYNYLDGKKSRGTVKVCGSCNYQIKLDNIDMDSLFSKLSQLSNIQTTEDCLILNDVILFKSGRALVRAKTKEKARAILDKYLG
jgi:adenylyltransferase/sulfurtransferase